MQDFELIYNTYAPKIYRLCLGYTGDEEIAQDLLQETFIAVWSSLDTFRGEASLSTWIYRIASNKCLREMQVAKRMPKVPFGRDIALEDSSEIEEKHAILLQCISMLKETDRLIISLELEGLPQAEIASIVGLSEVNVRVKLFRIRDKIKQMLLTYEQFR